MFLNCPTCNASVSPSGICPHCGAQLPPHPSQFNLPQELGLPAGTRLSNGSYEIRSILGQGGFGITYGGYDHQLAREIAIKEFFSAGSTRSGLIVSPPSQVSKQENLQYKRSFIDEARSLARFNDAGIVKVFNVFEENNTAYIVMELLKGLSLQKHVEDTGPLSEKDLLDIIQQMGASLSTVHAAGLLHRDIKPDNIMIVTRDDGSPRPVLIDFGTARAFSAGQTHSMTRQLTPAYAPLEQYASKARFGPFTDIYALAGTCYYCLSGQIPVSALDRVNGVELVPLDHIRPDVRRDLTEGILRGMKMNATERPQTMEEFVAGLKQARNRFGHPNPINGQFGDEEIDFMEAFPELFEPSLPRNPVSPPNRTNHQAPVRPPLPKYSFRPANIPPLRYLLVQGSWLTAVMAAGCLMTALSTSKFYGNLGAFGFLTYFNLLSGGFGAVGAFLGIVYSKRQPSTRNFAVMLGAFALLLLVLGNIATCIAAKGGVTVPEDTVSSNNIMGFMPVSLFGSALGGFLIFKT